MSDDTTLTPTRIAALLAFLPALSKPGRSFFAPSEQPVAAHYPVYADDVTEFFREAGQPWWADYSYEPRSAGRMLEDESRVGGCTLDELKTMLTYCVRSERFGDGAWGRLLETGRVVALLRRLEDLATGKLEGQQR